MKRKRLLLGVAAVCIAFFGVRGIIEICHRADCPEDILKRSSMEDIQQIIYGDESCMIVGADGKGNCEYKIIAKDEKGYRVPGLFTTKTIFSSVPGFSGFDILQVSGTSDYYIVGMGIREGNPLTIEDCLASRFYIIDHSQFEDGIEREQSVYCYFAYLHSFEEGYSITVDGKTFFVEEIE